MELPQQRPFGTERRKPTHDFLALHTHSTVQQDPGPPSQGGDMPQIQSDIISRAKGGYLKTHDFLQPLERVGKATAKEETNIEISTIEKPPPPAPPPSVEHILPGGIGTYSVSHISYFNQRVPKPEGTTFTIAQAGSNGKNEESSNCSSYTGRGFALWEESALKKGKTGKENLGERSNIVRGAAKAGQWTTSERPSQSLSSSHRNSLSSLSSSQPAEQKSQSFMEIIKSAKFSTQDDDFDDEVDFVLKKESSSPIRKGELRVKVDGKSTDQNQKANTPRSKHSATEQRRRSKINDRFQMLRELIPRGDQKRDKASFLLEVIEYIQFLQEKVQKYEGSHQGWNYEPAKLVPWGNNSWPVESYVDQSRGINSGAGPALLFAAKLEKNVIVSPTIAGSAQNPVESDMSSASTFKAMDHHPGITDKTVPIPMSVQPSIFNPGRNGGAVPQFPPTLAFDAENMATQPQLQSCLTRSCTANGAVTSDKLKEQELCIEAGTISISSVYSKGLLNTLTQALQSSGVDLSQASISVQIELGKRGNSASIAPASNVKDDEVPSSNQGTKRSRLISVEESDQALRKPKRGKS